jgi:hypothetical protein
MDLKMILAIFGLILGVVLILAAIFNWKIVPVPSDYPSVGTPAPGLPKAIRAMVGVVGAILALLGILTLAKVF